MKVFLYLQNGSEFSCVIFKFINFFRNILVPLSHIEKLSFLRSLKIYWPSWKGNNKALLCIQFPNMVRGWNLLWEEIPLEESSWLITSSTWLFGYLRTLGFSFPSFLFGPKCSISIPLEIVRKPLVFWLFQRL